MLLIHKYYYFLVPDLFLFFSLAGLPEKPTPIDWSVYTAGVKKKALVQKFQAAVSA